jgi:hypothetical protein
MVPEEPTSIQNAPAAIGTLLDALADRLAARLLALFERRADIRALTLARIDLSTLRNVLDVAGASAPLAKARELATRVAEQLEAATR